MRTLALEVCAISVKVVQKKRERRFPSVACERKPSLVRRAELCAQKSATAGSSNQSAVLLRASALAKLISSAMRPRCVRGRYRSRELFRSLRVRCGPKIADQDADFFRGVELRFAVKKDRAGQTAEFAAITVTPLAFSQAESFRVERRKASHNQFPPQESLTRPNAIRLGLLRTLVTTGCDVNQESS